MGFEVEDADSDLYSFSSDLSPAGISALDGLLGSQGTMAKNPLPKRVSISWQRISPLRGEQRSGGSVGPKIASVVGCPSMLHRNIPNSAIQLSSTAHLLRVAQGLRSLDEEASGGPQDLLIGQLPPLVG